MMSLEQAEQIKFIITRQQQRPDLQPRCYSGLLELS
jgi:hypothetical protein